MVIKQDTGGGENGNGGRYAYAGNSGECAGPLFEPLVPIRLDLVVDGKHVTETFTWNMMENSMTPRQFVTMLAIDLGLTNTNDSDTTHIEALEQSMKEQIDAFVPPKQPIFKNNKNRKGNESRQVVRLNVRMGRVVLRDQFEWDINSADNCPESFARQLCSEVGLGSAYAPAVAHAVREQLNDLAEYSERRPERSPVDIDSVLRRPETTNLWEPQVVCLSMEEQERLERKEKREARLQRRNRGKDTVFGLPHSLSNGGYGGNGGYPSSKSGADTIDNHSYHHHSRRSRRR